MSQHNLRKPLVLVAVLILLGLLIAGGRYSYENHFASHTSTTYKTPEESSDVYVRFEMEAYDSIQTNYWQKGTDADYANLFQLSAQKALASSGTSTTSVPVTLATSTRTGVAEMIAAAMKSMKTDDEKKQFALTTLQVALYNLAPNGRDELLSNTQEKALRNDVSNINTTRNLYTDIGATTTADTKAINAAYAKRAAEIAASTSTTKAADLAAVSYARTVLTNQTDKQQYDATGAEPTVFTNVVGKTLYVYIDKMSPTTLQEFAIAVDAASSTPLDSMIIDLRGNVGGALDIAPGFLGIFVGQNQYAFDLFHQGDYNVIRTTAAQFPELTRYRDIAILTDSMTQSTAELITASFKRYRLAHVVGTTTRGWGTVENTFPLSTTIDPTTQYALLLVHSLTLRDDNQPIEGAGVTPDVDITKAGWQGNLGTYFKSASLISALKTMAVQPPKY